MERLESEPRTMGKESMAGPCGTRT